MKYCRMALLILMLAVSSAQAGESQPVKPSPQDKCPVCGMFVAKYPDFLAQMIFKDGSYALFDGVKDMMKYYFEMSKYIPSKTVADIGAIYVTDYYSLTAVDGHKCRYVVGSKVYGPMGKELIPLPDEAAVKEFMRDHGGSQVVSFEQITPALVNSLD